MRLVTDVLSVGFRSEWNSTLLARIRRGNQNESLENRRIRLAEPQCATESRKGKVTKVLRPKQKIGSEENQGRDSAISCEVRLGHLVMFRSLITSLVENQIACWSQSGLGL